MMRNFFDNYIESVSAHFLMLWILSFVLMIICGMPLIVWLRQRKGMKWTPREDTPDSHGRKAGIPSMGGIGIIGTSIIGLLGVFTFHYAGNMIERSGQNLSFSEVLPYSYLIFPIIVLLHAVLGYIDDYCKATNRGGISSKAKLFGQIVLAAIFLVAVYAYLVRFAASQSLTIAVFDWPLFDSWPLLVGALLIVIGTSNAVNLTDGIDGLAAGLSVQVGVAFIALSFLSPQGFFNFFGTSAISFWACLGGACLGFLAFNKHPAKVFMGDTGSLALGAALGAGAILTRTVWLLPFIGFIFYIEMFSVIAQVLYFKYTRRKFGEGKRLFKRAPLHHHFELSGWSEWRVVATFWGVNLVTTIIGLVLWKIGILPRFP